MTAKAFFFVALLVQIICGLSAAPFFGATPFAATEFPCASAAAALGYGAGPFGYGTRPFAFDGPFGYDVTAGPFGYGGFNGGYDYGPYGFGAALL